MTDETTTEAQTSEAQTSETQTDLPAQTAETQEQGSSSSTTETQPEAEPAKSVLGAAADGDDETTTAVDETKTEDAPVNEYLGAPEGDYEVEGLPEGVTPDVKVMETIGPIAKEIGLSNKAVSRLAVAYNDQILPHVVQSLVAEAQANHDTTVKEWATEGRTLVEADAKLPETERRFGGQSYDEVVRTSAKAIQRFGSPELRTFLDQTGAGNHPELLAFAYKAGALISEDKDFERGGTAPTEKSRVEKYYPSTT
jgi:hypothetical protein